MCVCCRSVLSVIAVEERVPIVEVHDVCCMRFLLVFVVRCWSLPRSFEDRFEVWFCVRFFSVIWIGPV